MTHKRPLQKNSFLPRGFLLLVTLFFLLCPVSSFSDGTVPADRDAVPGKKYQTLEARWGVRPVAIRLTAADYFVDFRYVIIDPEKAKAVLSRSKQNREVFLLDQKTGKKFSVPVTKVGPLRSTTLSPKKGRQYTILFSNAGKSIKKGDKVSVIIGEFKVENLTVE
jgi:hypothetical protein